MKQPDFTSPIAPRLRDALREYERRHDADLTWAELGRRAAAVLGEEGVDTSKISRIKLGQQEPSVRDAGAFAYVLDVSIVWLLYNIGDMGRFPRPGAESSTERPAPKSPRSRAETNEETAKTSKPNRRRG